MELLDISGPVGVFATASALPGATAGAYEVEVAALRQGPVVTSSGLSLVATRTVAALGAGIDTLLVPGTARGVPGPALDAIVRALRQRAGHARRIASVCTGAFVLARAGLLTGRRATTHWAARDALAARHPDVAVEADAIFVRDGRVWTSAGVTSGIDLALALVEEDFGSDAALTVARWLVVYLKRPGGQAQFSAPLAAQAATHEPLREILDWAREHPGDDLSVHALAGRAGMSVRHFARVFAREVGGTPAVHIEELRVEAARRLLETTDAPVKAIARDSGFGTAETLHRAFIRRVGVTPAQYRQRFSRRAVR